MIFYINKHKSQHTTIGIKQIDYLKNKNQNFAEKQLKKDSGLDCKDINLIGGRVFKIIKL